VHGEARVADALQNADEVGVDLDGEQAGVRPHGAQQGTRRAAGSRSELHHQGRLVEPCDACDAPLEEARARDDGPDLTRTREEALEEGEAVVGLESQTRLGGHDRISD
jgi:hypothetical protein